MKAIGKCECIRPDYKVALENLVKKELEQVNESIKKIEETYAKEHITVPYEHLYDWAKTYKERLEELLEALRNTPACR